MTTTEKTDLTVTPTDASATSTTPATTPTTSRPPARRPRSLAELMWSGWPALDELWPSMETMWPLREGAAPSAAAPIRIEEAIDGKDLVVRAELPGVDPDKDIEVSVDDGVLTIKAERTFSMGEKEKQTYRSEFQYGSFLRRLRLPTGASEKDVTATYRDGVLEVRLPAPGETSGAQKVPIARR
jgi:HSP20 family protein